MARRSLAVGRKMRARTCCAVKARMVVLVRQSATARLQQHGALRGHHQHVEHVAGAGAAQMRVREAHDRTIGLVIARTSVPSKIVGIRTQLHHAVGHRCARIGMAMPAGADEHIDIARYTAGRLCEEVGWPGRNGGAGQALGQGRQGAAKHGKRAHALQELSAGHHGEVLRKLRTARNNGWNGTAAARLSRATAPDACCEHRRSTRRTRYWPRQTSCA